MIAWGEDVGHRFGEGAPLAASILGSGRETDRTECTGSTISAKGGDAQRSCATMLG